MRYPWSKQPPPTPALDPHEWSQRYQDALAEAGPNDPISDLPPFSDPPQCQKCGHASAMVVWRQGVHPGCPNTRMATFYAPGMSTSPETAARLEHARTIAVEHHDRRCDRCGYAWVEAVRGETA